ncbi:MAG TPA: protein kinase [Polyangiaceae bacterium]|jgi:serine/threonine protein kinase
MPEGLSQFAAGTVVAGDFRIVRLLSEGGMGAVYVAEQLSTGRERALKVMLRDLVSDPILRKRFEQEARVASRIESEHVVEVVGAGVDAASHVPWLAMELLRGEDLSQLVERRGALAFGEVLALFEQLCHALGAAHDQGVVHRDLKPENVFLAESRRAGAAYTVKVLDFGIAKVLAEANTKRTAAMGSPMWMAPEQTEQSAVTPATDVWALGLIAFWLLTGRYFWKVANTDEVTIPRLMREMLFEPIPAATERARELGVALPASASFDVWFARAVAREPSARFANARALHDEFRLLAGSAAPSVSESQPLLPAPITAPTVPFDSAQAPLAATMPTPAQPVPKTLVPILQTTSEANPPPAKRRAPAALAVVALVLFGGVALAFKLKSAHVAPSPTPSASGAPAAPASVELNLLPLNESDADLAPSADAQVPEPAPSSAALSAAASTAHVPVPAKSVAPSAPPPSFTLRIGVPHTTGGLTPDAAHRIVRAKHDQYRACFAEGQQRNPKLSGRVALRLTINAHGRVTAAHDAGGDLSDVEVTRCIQIEAQTLVFPDSDGPTSATVPFVFTLGS